MVESFFVHSPRGRNAVLPLYRLGTDARGANLRSRLQNAADSAILSMLPTDASGDKNDGVFFCMQNYKIVADSSCDFTALDGASFEAAPLKIITAEHEYTDDAALDVASMVETLLTYNGKSSTSCPNVGDWLGAFGDAEHVFCVTITGTLSGSYNSAMQAKSHYEELYPDRRVYVLNSLSAGAEIGLILRKIKELVQTDLSFEEICKQIEAYSAKTGLLFVLESMQNLANNGRVSPLVAKMAGLLGIRVIGKASDRGDLEQLHKARGEKKMIETTVQTLIDLGLKTGKVFIAHCLNEPAAQKLKEALAAKLPAVVATIYPTGGLCSFYAEKGGLMIGFEKV